MSNETRRILLVEDEKNIRDAVTAYLERENYWVTAVGDGQDALEEFQKHHFDLVILDLMLPRVPGERVCRVIRDTSDVPIIMLTAKGDDMDKILGLEYGADDYITKPFNILEVKARIKAIMRRTEPRRIMGDAAAGPSVVESGEMRLDCEGRRAYIANKEIGLTAKEFEVLELLMLNPNKVYSRENLLQLVWGADYPGDVRTVDVHIRRLREKVEQNPSEPRYVHTKWGVGYYFQND